MNVQRSRRRYFNIYLYLPTVWGYPRGVFRGVMEYAVPRCRWRFLHEPDRYEDDATLPVACNGAILLASTPRMIRWAELCGRPVVLVSGRMPKVQRCAIVCHDDERVGGLAAEHLLELGLKRLAYLPHDDGPICTRRRRGFEEAAARHGAEVLSLPAGIVRDRRIADHLGRTVRSWIEPGSNRWGYLPSMTGSPACLPGFAGNGISGCRTRSDHRGGQ